MITFAKACELTPMNGLVLLTEFQTCLENVIQSKVVPILGASCTRELLTAIETPPLDTKWALLLASPLDGGGALSLMVAWAVYLEWLTFFGRNKVVTKGSQNRESEYSKDTEMKQFETTQNLASNKFEQFAGVLRDFLSKNKADYPCLPKVETCAPKRIKTPFSVVSNSN